MRKTTGGMIAAALSAGLAGVVMAQAPNNADERVKMGVDAWQAGNYPSAVAIWRPLALAGNADAQYDLAQAYRLGHGVQADQKIALDWYRKAADQGHEQAQANYGLMLFQNGDQKGAIPWLRKAGDHGDARAQYVVGTALFNGDLVTKDWPRAYAMMTRAAAAGLPQAQTSLSEMDHYLTIEQREQGTRLAATMTAAAASAPTPGPTASAAPARAAPAPAPAPVRPVAPVKMASAPAIRPAPVPPSAPVKPVAPPAPPPHKEAAKAAPATPAVTVASAPAHGGWRVQLGAFGTQAKAQSLWSGLSGHAAALGGKQPYFIPVGKVTRLQAGPFASRADASRACAAIKAKGQDCFPAVD